MDAVPAVPLYAALLLLSLSRAPHCFDSALAQRTAGAAIESFEQVVSAPADPGVILPRTGGSSSSGHEESSGGQEKPPSDADEKKPPTPAHTGIHALLGGLVEDVKHLPSKENGFIALAGGAGALAVHPADRSFNVHLRSHYTLVNDIYTPGKWVGQTPVIFGSAILVYALGRRNDQPKVSHFGMDLMRALIINEALTDILKYATDRERPDHSDALSFPSGHSSTTFTAATVIERHLGWKYSALGYTIASYVASSRLHDNRHWLSDVVFGAAVGTISGRTVTQHGRNVWTFAPAAVPGGVAVVAVRR